jgi:hypothetical protein
VSARPPEEASTAADPKRAVSDARQKEVPAFEWKLVGYADGLTLTLLKSVEHKDAEAQLNRLQSEGYYDGLAIYPIDAPVPPPPSSRRQRGGNVSSRKGTARAKQGKARKGDAKRSAKRAPVGKKKAGSPARSKAASARKARPAQSKRAKSAGKTKKKSRTKS